MGIFLKFINKFFIVFLILLLGMGFVSASNDIASYDDIDVLTVGEIDASVDVLDDQKPDNRNIDNDNVNDNDINDNKENNNNDNTNPGINDKNLYQVNDNVNNNNPSQRSGSYMIEKPPN